MSRRNTDAITIHSILDWIEDNLESPLSLEKSVRAFWLLKMAPAADVQKRDRSFIRSVHSHP